MPTIGYTAILEEKENVSFKEFALRCADVETLDELKLNSYHKRKEIAEAKKRLNNAKNMPDDEAKKIAHEDYISQLESYIKSRKEDTKLAIKYGDMLVQVTKWKVPSSNHEGLRNLMIDQLKQGLKNDCNHRPDIPEEMSGTQYKKKLIADAEKNIIYHQDKYIKEVNQIEKDTHWVNELVKSLPAE